MQAYSGTAEVQLQENRISQHLVEVPRSSLRIVLLKLSDFERRLNSVTERGITDLIRVFTFKSRIRINYNILFPIFQAIIVFVSIFGELS